MTPKGKKQDQVGINEARHHINGSVWPSRRRLTGAAHYAHQGRKFNNFFLTKKKVINLQKNFNYFTQTLILGSTLLCLASADSHRNGLKMIVGIKQPQYGVQIFRGAGARQKAIDAGIINPFNSHFSGNSRGSSGGHTGGLGGNNGGAGGVNGDGSGASGNHNGGANGNGGTVHNNYTPIPPKTTTHPPTTTPAPTTTTTTTTTPAPTTTYATAPPPTRPPYSPPKPPVHPTTYPVPPYPRPTPPLYRPPTHPPRKYGSPPSGYSHPQYKPVEKG